jgi:PAS domain S-box-containing protein
MKLSIQTKLLVVIAGIALLSVAVSGYTAFTTGRASLEIESFNKLTAVREMKSTQIEEYFSQISGQVTTLSQDRMVIEALRNFDTAFSEIETELEISVTQSLSYDRATENYYNQIFIPRLTQNLLRDVPVDAYWPREPATRILQYLYITNNQYETGLKHLLDDPQDGSTYSSHHAIYHPIIRNFLETFGYYDIFLVNRNGFIVYSVFKEIDFGTSLLTGPYSQTNFSKAFRSTRNADSSDYVHLEDFRPYHPSYDAPASFIATPIFDGNINIGSLIFQMPVDKINNIMTNNQAWSDVGLGESGETYLVGEDFTLRNQSRFLIEDAENYFRAIEENGVELLTSARIKNLNSTIGLQEVRTEGTAAALAGETGTAIFPDYRNVPVLSAYKPLDIQDVDWVIMSEIDEAEAFGPITELRNRISLAAGVLAISVIAIAVLVARSITKPIADLTEASELVAAGNLERRVIAQSSDEIGDLANSFEDMRISMRKLIADLEEINSNLEGTVAKRTKALEKSSLQAQLLYKSSEVAVENFTIDGALTKVITDVSKLMKWDIGHVYFPVHKKRKVVLHPSSLWYLRNKRDFKTFKAVTQETIFEKGEGLPGRVFQSGKVAWIKNVQKDKNFPRNKLSKNLSVKGAVGVPLTVENEVVAILEFFSRKEIKLDRSMVAILELVAEQMNRVYERLILEERVRGNEERLNYALEGSSDGLWDWNIQTGDIYYSPRWEMMLGYEPGEIAPEIESWEKLVDPSHLEKANERMREHLEGRTETYEAEYRARSKSGDWVWILARGKVASFDENEKPLRFVGTHVDITEQKRLETKLQIVNQRMEDELNVARDIQIGMLPRDYPAFPERNDILVHADLNSARQVGGDFYDYYFVDDEHFCFVIGDVSGKGAPGALFMAVSKTLVKSRAQDDFSTASILTHVNDEISKNNPNSMFVTMFLGILNVKTGRMTYSNAGHNPPYLLRKDGTTVRFDTLHGPVLGAMGGMVYREEEIQLSLNDRIFVYTDGVTEAMDIKDKLYSEERLAEYMEKIRAYSVEDINNSVMKDVRAHIGKAVQSDDITILALTYSNQIQEGEVKSLALEILNKYEEMPIVFDSWKKFAKENAIDDKLRRNVSVVIDEFLNNIISYAYEDEIDHVIEIVFKLSGNRFVMSLIDDGKPFNPFEKDSLKSLNTPHQERKLGGFGIHFVKSIMDEYHYDRKIDKNEITLIKVLESN